VGVLSDQQITRLCQLTPPLIDGYIDWEWQLQPAGFDLSVEKIFVLDGAGTISKVRQDNVSPAKHELNPDQNGNYRLPKGYYLVQFREILCLPKHIVGLAYPRSTLIRYGAAIITGVWDPGFHGRSQCGLLVANEHGIRINKDSAILQMTFHTLTDESSGFAYNYLYKSGDGQLREL